MRQLAIQHQLHALAGTPGCPVGVDAVWPPLYVDTVDAGTDRGDQAIIQAIYSGPRSTADKMAITSSSYLVFSFIVIYMAMLCTRQRQGQ